MWHDFFFQIEKLLFLKVKGIDHVEKCTSSSSNNYAMHFLVKETKEGKTLSNSNQSKKRIYYINLSQNHKKQNKNILMKSRDNIDTLFWHTQKQKTFIFGCCSWEYEQCCQLYQFLKSTLAYCKVCNLEKTFLRKTHFSSFCQRKLLKLATLTEIITILHQSDVVDRVNKFFSFVPKERRSLPLAAKLPVSLYNWIVS